SGDRDGARAADARSAHARSGSGRRRRVGLHPLARDDQGGAGDRAARQLRGGPARPSPPQNRRNADVPDRYRRSRPRRRARGAPPPRPVPALVLTRRPPGPRHARDAARQEGLTAQRPATTTPSGASVAAEAPPP